MADDTPKTAAMPHQPVFKLLQRLVQDYMRPYAGSVGVALFFMAVTGATTAMLAWLMKPVMDDVLGGNRDKIIPVAIAIFVTFIAQGGATYAYTVVMNKVTQSIIGDMQKKLFSHFMEMDIAFFHANPSGQLISRVVNDVSMVRLALTDTLTNVGKNFVTFVFLSALMFHQDWKLATAAFLVLPITFGFIAHVGKKLRKISKSAQVETGFLANYLSQVFQGIRQVKAYGMEESEKIRAGRAIESVRRLNLKAIRVGTLLTPVNEILVGIVICLLIVYGGHQIAEGQLTKGELASFLAAFGFAYEPIKRMARVNNILQTGLGAAERVFEMMDSKPAINDRPGAAVLSAARPEISFKDVEFHYAGSDSRALRGVSFTAKPGQVTALVGASGAGKSTIMNMILRFYEPISGTVSVDGRDVRDLTINSLRRHIALVSQDITIFDDSAAANIGYGRIGATEDEIIDAAKAAAAHEFIMALPDGYQTRLGEHGVKLSGGQRQRISIARAILRDAPIFLLDEATSALDNESEQAVQAAFAVLEKGRTTIVIAHRLSTVLAADNIIVMDHGRVIEAGRHDELMALGGLYARMYKAGLKG
jgi:subfamily B ATP-binding cassette protein MsbA